MTVGLFTDREEQIRQNGPRGHPRIPVSGFSANGTRCRKIRSPADRLYHQRGLPEGWSMEQWEHYGQQYLDSQS